MQSQWRCAIHGQVSPLHCPDHISTDIVVAVSERAQRVRGGNGEPVPVWCPWPLPRGWTVTGIAWAGDDRTGPRATAICVSGPAPLGDGPADAVFVAEEPGVGFGPALAGSPGPDPGPSFPLAVQQNPAPAKVRVEGHPTPLWPVEAPPDRSAYAGEARGVWLYAIAWPAPAGYLLAEPIVLHDLALSIPAELVFGAPSRRLRPNVVQQ
jgi:hypothetical protein